MTKTKNSKRKRPARVIKDKLEDDNIYILKLVLLLVISTQWVRITNGDIAIPIPIGALIGILLVRRESMPTDRKIGYTILLMSMFIAFWLPIGIELKI